ncbi:transmembrane protein 255B [Osmerus mordax]|uniref:transmembrane protein 255B n=1 Tax=Osmerus mordax TaxID=8014 RepID=UPI00350F3286
MKTRIIADVADRDKTASMRIQKETMMRRRRCLLLVLGMLCLSLLLVVLGIYTTTRTESLSIIGYSSGVILAFGSFLGVLGLCLEENRKQLIVAAIVFLSLGVMTSFLCLVVDGVFIVFNMDVRPLKAGRCQFYTSGSSYIYENYYAAVPCRGLVESCTMNVRSGTCYCCDLYDCANGGYMNNYYEFVGVQSCQDVMSLYLMIWLMTSLNLVAFFMGILTTAVLGSVKDLKSFTSQLSSEGGDVSSPTAPLLIESNTHAGNQRQSPYFSPGILSGSQTDSLETSAPDPNPPPFAPLYNLLPFKSQGFSV